MLRMWLYLACGEGKGGVFGSGGGANCAAPPAPSFSQKNAPQLHGVPGRPGAAQVWHMTITIEYDLEEPWEDGPDKGVALSKELIPSGAE